MTVTFSRTALGFYVVASESAEEMGWSERAVSTFTLPSEMTEPLGKTHFAIGPVALCLLRPDLECL